MDKLTMMSKDKVQENIEKIQRLFPNAVTEVLRDGKPTLAVDFDVLKQEMSSVLIDEREERYQMTWPDKKKSILLSNTPISATLRPCKEESVDFDNTQNLYIEGDNVNVLKLLQETYLGKIKMIYIDPPYNTGNNIIYKNDFSISLDEYLEIAGEVDEYGNRMFINSGSSGRLHTEWLNMIYPALKLSKDLLTSDGYITVAIDDNELYNIKKLMDEVFGEINYVGTIITRCNPQGRNKNNIDPVHEYHLVYAKNIIEMPLLKIKKESGNSDYRYLLRSGTNSRREERPYRYFPLLVKDGKVSVIPEEEYNAIYINRKEFDDKYVEELKKAYEDKGYTFVLPIARNGEAKVWQRMYERVKQECASYVYQNGQILIPCEEERTPVSLWQEEKYSNVAYGANRLKELFGTNKSPFDFSKSIYTVKDLISLNTSGDDIILDFFPGSGTTAEAVLQLNSEDGAQRKYILVQLPEECSKDSDGYKLGFKTIPEIARKRIKLSSAYIKNVKDLGFRVLKLDSSNMKDVYYRSSDYNQDLLSSLESNIKEDRTPLDLLFQVMLELGKPLSAKIEENEIANKKVFVVDDNDLIACFDENITEDVVKAIAQKKPLYAVFRDNSFSSDTVAANFEQIFATYSPNTTRKVL